MTLTKLIRLLLIAGVATTNFSCSKESDQNGEVLTIEEKLVIESKEETPGNPILIGEKKEVRYELSGDFSGKLDITFLSSEGFTPPNQILGVQIPWKTSYSIPEDAQAIGGFANGFYGDANSGESATLKMFYDEKLVETVIRTADEEGVNLPLEIYSLDYEKINRTIAQENVGQEIQYALEGDFSGSVTIVYKEADGSRTNIIVSQLPWTYTLNTTEQSARVSFYGLCNDGLKGETITSSLFVNGQIINSQTVTPEDDGSFISFSELSVDFD